MGDRFALTTLLQNLLSNANKYTPRDGCIKVSTEVIDGHILLTVEDSGVGIPNDQTPFIFERFYRIDGDRHPSGETGCGLGLAIVKRIVDLHHASISIMPSSLTSGTAFKIIFPLNQQPQSLNPNHRQV